MTDWVDGFFVDKVADPEQAYQDAREAHGYVTRELATASGQARTYNLTQERNRLASIAWALKRRIAKGV